MARASRFAARHVVDSFRRLGSDWRCSALAPVDRPLPIMFADRWERFVVINKPPGLPCVEAEYLFDSIRVRMAQELPWVRKCWFPHRLDKHAQGLMVVAFSNEACADLGKSLMAGEWRKRYRVLATVPPLASRRSFVNDRVSPSGRSQLFTADGGLAEAGTISAFIGDRCPVTYPHPSVQASILRRAVLPDDEDSKPKACTTHFTLLSHFEELGLALYDVTLATGRTHQIRVHFAESGMPLANDWYYNESCTHWAPSDNLPGELGLQAYELELPLLPPPASHLQHRELRVERAAVPTSKKQHSSTGRRRLGRWLRRDAHRPGEEHAEAYPWMRAEHQGADSSEAGGKAGEAGEDGSCGAQERVKIQLQQPWSYPQPQPPQQPSEAVVADRWIAGDWWLS